MITHKDILLRKTLAGLVFTMTFLLTPRAWVDDNAVHLGSAQIPIQMLEQPDQCLWCSGPAQAPDCKTGFETQENRVWINPDKPIFDQKKCRKSTQDNNKLPSS